MKFEIKMVLVSVIMLSALIIPNAPIVKSNNGHTTTCNSEGCTKIPIYESILQAYAPCLFGCFTPFSVKTVTVSSTTLYIGVTASATTIATSNFTFSLNNPGADTTIISISIVAQNASTPAITVWDATPVAGLSHVDFQENYTKGATNAFVGNQVSSFTLYPWTNSSERIMVGQIYNYVIAFSNGQDVSGSLIPQ